MNCVALEHHKTVEKAMQDAWIAWHGDMDEEDIPMVNPSFNRAWLLQQNAVDRANLRVTVMQSAISIAARQLRLDAKYLNLPQLNDIADLLSTVKQITEQK